MSGHYVRPFLSGLGIFAAVYVIESGLASAGVYAPRTLFYGALLGAIAGLAVFSLLRELDASRELSRRRYHENLISQLNHHVRNALQLILNRAELDVQNARELRDIQNAVNRIEWSLREILPKVISRAVPNSSGSPFLTTRQPGAPMPRPCAGVYPWYVYRKERLIENESGSKPAEDDQQVQTSVLRNKSA